MTKHLPISTVKWFLIHFFISFKGFYFLEEVKRESGKHLIGTYTFILSNDSKILFNLYKVIYKVYDIKYFFSKKLSKSEYTLIADFNDTLPEHIIKYNKLHLKSNSFLIKTKDEELLLKMLVDRYITFMKKRIPGI